MDVIAQVWDEGARGQEAIKKAFGSKENVLKLQKRMQEGDDRALAVIESVFRNGITIGTKEIVHEDYDLDGMDDREVERVPDIYEFPSAAKKHLAEKAKQKGVYMESSVEGIQNISDLKSRPLPLSYPSGDEGLDKLYHEGRPATGGASEVINTKPENSVSEIPSQAYLDNLESGARRFNALDAAKLASCYGITTYNVKGALFRKTVKNPHLSPDKAIYWSKISYILSGVEEPEDLDKFLNEYCGEQLKTPAGKFQAGYWIVHNIGTRDVTKGIDLLKHAASEGSAFAARELGEIFDGYNPKYVRGVQPDLAASYTWYKLAESFGHPNGAARASYLLKRHPELASCDIDHNLARNPSKAYLDKYPGATAVFDLQEPDYSFLYDRSYDTHLERLELASALTTEQTAQFNRIINDIMGSVGRMLDEEQTLHAENKSTQLSEKQAIAANRAVDKEVEKHEKQRQLARNRWIKESGATTAIGLALLALGAGAGGVDITSASTLLYQGLLHTKAQRSTSHFTAASGESNFHKGVIDCLTASRIDVSKHADEIAKITAKLEDISKSLPVQQLRNDEFAKQRLLKGFLRQQLLAQGIEYSKGLGRYASEQGLSLDEFLQFFHSDCGDALQSFALGFANSNDLHILLAYADTLKWDDPALPPAHKALKHFVEELAKPAIDELASKASRMDVIESAFKDIRLLKLGNADQANLQAEAQHNRAMAALIQTEFSTVGSAHIAHLFNLYLHRHGNEYLRDTMVNDGLVTDGTTPKSLTVMAPEQQGEFVDRVVHSYAHGRTTLPDVKHLFLRICGSEYFKPQSILTSGAEATFRNNPQAPVAYPMINEVINNFIERMSVSPIARYREVIGPKLDNLITQSFIDFFAVVGQVHTSQFQNEMAELATAHDMGNYNVRYRMAVKAITDDAVKRYDLFKEVFTANLNKTLEVGTEPERENLMKQLEKLRDEGSGLFDPEKIIIPGSDQAFKLALERRKAFENMYLPGSVRTT